MAFFSVWSPLPSYLLLSAATLLLLIPFSGKAFHLDDTLFLFAAKQIVRHPFDPYGFQLVWNVSAERMSDITKNPPLACYYSAMIGRLFGWSERALHFAFLPSALAVVLGTYRLAQRWTRAPVLAALSALLTPGFLVSATSVMCDTTMVALWIWAVILWIEGLEPAKPLFLVSSVALIAASTLTKYFGLALVPLLFVYSLIRLRKIGAWVFYFALPVFVLICYEVWTGNLYGQGLISSAAEFAGRQREFQSGSTMAHALVGLSFAGGCALTALTLGSILWSWKRIAIGTAVSGLAAAALTFNWVDYGLRVGGTSSMQAIMSHWHLTFAQIALCSLSGLCVLALGVSEVWNRRDDADSWLLGLWTVGTWFFAGFLNWTVNARSVLPLVPAVGILLVRRLDRVPAALPRLTATAVVVSGLAISGFLSLWVTVSDVAWANSAREAANRIYEKTRGQSGTLFFMGHWGFQYYMQNLGFKPADEVNSTFEIGDIVAVPGNNIEYPSLPQQMGLAPVDQFELLTHNLSTTMGVSLGAGFYSSYWGPLPFAFGKVPPEVYEIGRLVPYRAPGSQ